MYRSIDLFAGIGGIRKGFDNAFGDDIKTVFVSEWDEYAQKTYRLNYQDDFEIAGDITQIDEKDIPEFDICLAGFPCQAFSLAGKRMGFDDDYKGMCRGTLFQDVVRICEYRKPKVIFCENVKGLTIHDRGRTFRVIKKSFEQIGYTVYDRVLNSKDFGVPQNRERIYIVAFRNDIDSSSFQFPEGNNADTCIRDILEEQEVSVKYYLSTVYMETLRKHKERHQAKGNGFGYEIRDLDGQAGAIVCGGMGRERNLVIDKRLTNFVPVTHIKGEVNREGIRKMTPREWARLQGFPDDFKLELADTHLYKQFGNSVTVNVIEAIAKEIRRVLANGRNLENMEVKMREINLYNTLTKKIEPFQAQEEGKVKMYTCGPTVYHYAHIGNLRSYIMEDILEKYFRYAGYDVKRVMNITDVGHLSSDADSGEDKMLQGAKRERKTVMEIAEFYRKAFFEDCEKLKIKTPDVVEPATNCIADFIHMTEKLLEDGYAYVAGGNVYFDTSKLKEYYVLSNQNEEELMVGARDDVEEDTNKRSKTDFVLWFTKSKFDDQELKWDSPWGIGYPGWHIECSCISIRHLGEYLDIHCGGVDNIFPHHTNEIAQSESYLGHKWCNYWFHVQHLNDKRGKMSKSAGGFLTVSSLEEKGYSPMVYRMFCLQSHYRKPLVFSYEVMDNVKTAYAKLKKRVAALDSSGGADAEQIAVYQAQFAEAMGSDLNTSQALTVLYDVLKADINDASKRALVEDFEQVLSLGLLETEDAEETGGADEELTAWIEEKITERKEAKKAKDFAKADAIRAELAERGVEIRDTREGTVWELVAH